MPSDQRSRLPCLLIIGPRESPRVKSFAETANRLGAADVSIISYRDAIHGTYAPPPPGTLVRFESPGGCVETARTLLELGIDQLVAEGYQPISAADIRELSFTGSEIIRPRQWFLGLRAALKSIDSVWKDADIRWMSTPDSIVTAFDKAECLSRWANAALPIPHQFPGNLTYDEIRSTIAEPHARIFLKPRYGYSAMGAIALEWRDSRVRAITTVETVRDAGRTRLFVRKRPRQLQNESEIAALIDALVPEHLIIERWLPKARWNGTPYDLRVVMIDGAMHHVVGRACASPFTNLNLGARRMPREVVAQQLGDSWCDLEQLCKAAVSELPGAGMLGLDVLVRPNRKDFSLLEANAFGSYLPGLLHDGQTTYEAELRPHQLSTRSSATQSRPRDDQSDIVMITFDALRFDVAETAWRENRTPFLCSLIPNGWEPRHSPGSFTYAAHAALFAGFWPTPTTPGEHARPFALQFPGSRTVGPNTLKLKGSNIVAGLSDRGFHTICIGGVGFFDPSTPLGSVFPSYFLEHHWRPEFGVTAPHSTREQIRQACASVQNAPDKQPLFLFVNISATHPPTRAYLRGEREESTATQGAALAYVDRHLSPLFDALKNRKRRCAVYLMSDHGTLFGEEGWTGHRVGHSAVWTVPYAEFRLEATT